MGTLSQAICSIGQDLPTSLKENNKCTRKIKGINQDSLYNRTHYDNLSVSQNTKVKDEGTSVSSREFSNSAVKRVCSPFVIGLLRTTVDSATSQVAKLSSRLLDPPPAFPVRVK